MSYEDPSSRVNSRVEGTLRSIKSGWDFAISDFKFPYHNLELGNCSIGASPGQNIQIQLGTISSRY